MPLSEHEQRLLDQLERQLNAEDPRLASTLAEPGPRTGVPVRRLILGAVLAVAGLAVVLVGVSTHLVLVGVLGAALLGAGIFVVTSRGGRDSGGGVGRGPVSTARPEPQRGSFMSRLERDWDERRREQP